MERFRAAVFAVAFASFAAVAVLFPHVCARAGDEAATLLAKHRAFIGWQLGDGTFNTFHITGTATNEKNERLSTFDFRSAGLIYNHAVVATERSGLTTHEGFTGNLFWQSGVSGFTTPVYGDGAKYAAAKALLFNEGTTALPASFRGTEMVDGRRLPVVRVTGENADPIDLYVDPESGAFAQAVVDPDGPNRTTIKIVAYKEIAPGKRLLSTYRFLYDTNVTYAYDSIEPNVPISDAELHPPPPVASWEFGSQAKTPIHLTHTRILVDAVVNGVKGTFVLATGLDGIYLDDRFADRAHVDVLPNQTTYHDLAHKWYTRVRRMATFTVGDATLTNAIAFSLDFRHDFYQGIDFQGYDGFVGSTLFEGAVVDVNLSQSTMQVYDPSTAPAVSSGTPVSANLDGWIPTVPALLNRTIPIGTVLDTGVPWAWFDATGAHHASPSCPPGSTLTIGGTVIDASLPYCAEPGWLHVGYNVLKHFDFVFDYPHDRIVMIPNKM